MRPDAVPAPPDVPGVKFAQVPGHPEYLLGSDRSAWCCKHRGRPSTRAARAPSWRRIAVHATGRVTKRERLAVWTGRGLIYFRLDDLYDRLFGGSTLAQQHAA